MGAFQDSFQVDLKRGVGPVIVIRQLLLLRQFRFHFGLAKATADRHDDRLPFKPQHPRLQNGSFQILKLFLDQLALLIPQFLGQHLFGLNGGHAAKLALIGGDIQNHFLSGLGFLSHFSDFLQGNFVVWVFHLFHDCLGGQNPEPLLFNIQFHLKVGEKLFVKMGTVQPLCTPIALIAFHQRLPQCSLNRSFGQITFAANAFNHFSKSGQGNHGHNNRSRVWCVRVWCVRV